MGIITSITYQKIKFMNSSILLSVIIPVYNGEKCIGKCLDSILSQDSCDVPFEIIIIDDGSKDKTSEICKKYKEQYNNITTISQKNSGVSAARNKGIEIAKGEWITFCDCDDTVSQHWIRDFNLKENQHYDLISVGFNCNNWLYKGPQQVIIEDGIFDHSSISHLVTTLFKKNMLGFVWNKIFKASILKKNRIQFDTKIKYKEDLIFCLNYLCHTKYIIQLSTSNYYYIFSENIKKFGQQDNYSVNIKITKLLKEILHPEDFHSIEQNLMNELASSIIETYTTNTKTYHQHKEMWKETHSLFDNKKITSKFKFFNTAYCHRSFLISFLSFKTISVIKKND